MNYFKCYYVKKPILVDLVWLFGTSELCVMDWSTYYTVVKVFNK